MNFLITGGAGFIGSHLCERLLAAGHRVWAFDDLNSFYDPEIKRRNLAEVALAAVSRCALHQAQQAVPAETLAKKRPGEGSVTALIQTRMHSDIAAPGTGALRTPFVFVQGDITNRAALDDLLGSVKFDQIVHLAARAGVRPSLEEPALYQRVNVEGTVNVLESARLNSVKKVILASSSSVYGTNSRTPFAEGDPVLSAISPYAASKLACEALGHTYHHVYGMDIAALRFFTVYGPRQRPDLAIHKFARLMAANKPIPVYGDPAKSGRDYTFVTDIVEGILACTEKEFGYQILNLGDAHPVHLDQLIGLLESELGVRAEIQNMPPQSGDVPITFADISKGRRILGYEPKVKIEEGIALFVEWFKTVRDGS